MINKNHLKTGRRNDIKNRFIPHSKMERIGIPTGLFDRFGNEILSGMKVSIKPNYEGLVLYHRNMKCFGLFYGLWYGEKDLYNADCYGKFIEIPKDNGMRMEIEILDSINK
jgi:hypothetical protein